jgi:hypothetical protein
MMLSSESSTLNGSRVVGVINAQRRRVMPSLPSSSLNAVMQGDPHGS